MQWLAEISIKRPVFASVIVIALVVVGAFSYTKLGIDRFPKVDLPVVSITTRLDGAAGETIETEITDEIERAVNTISSIDELRSVSSEGVSQVFIQFLLEKDIDVATQEVRDKVSEILADLPADIDSPVISKVDPDAEPVLHVSVSADRPIREVSEFADKTLRRELESLSGVGEVQLVGARLRQVNLWFDPARLRAYGLTIAQVSDAVSRQNQELPGGTLTQGNRELSVRLEGRALSVAEFGELVVAEKNGTQVKLADVARVEDGTEEAETAGNVRGEPTIVLEIRRQSGTNTVAVVESLKERLAELESRLPSGYALAIIRDQSEYIEASVHTVQEHLVVGGLLAALVVWLFLRDWRSTLIAAISIPTSIVSTFALVHALGLTLNMMTLLALTLAVGIVIDDAIVVLENIQRVMDEKQISAFEAAREGTREIGLAVLATTLSLVAVFVPVAFMGGIVGRFMFSFGLTMAFSILVSLLVAFTLTPMLASRWLKPSARGAGHAHTSGKFFGALENGYVNLLRWTMGHRWVVVTASLLTLVSLVPLFRYVGKDFLPRNDESQFEVQLEAPEGTTLQQTELVATRVARRIEALDGVAYSVVLVGDDTARTANRGTIFVKLAPVSEREHGQFEIMDQVRGDVLPQFAAEELRTSVSPIAAIAGGGRDNKDVAFFVSGPDLTKLAEYADRLADALRKVPGAVDVDTSLVLGKPEMHVALDRAKAAELGVQVADVGSTLRLLVGGRKISDYDEGGEKYDVHARAGAQRRTDAASLAAMTVPSTKLGSVSLDHVARFEESSGPAEIDRLGRRRQVTITANVLSGYSTQSALDALNVEAKKLGMSSAYRAGVTGNSKEMGEAAKNFVLAFVLSFVFMYLILAAQFESWIHPITILLALPLTIPFALVSLFVFGQSLNIYTALGLLVLFGVVKKNAILQIDHTLQLRALGLSLIDATLQANRDRLRPILMTTLAFVAGMVPLLVSSGVGSGDNRAIGSVIFGGQLLSLLLTLLATPVAYSLFEDLRTDFAPARWAKHVFASLRGRGARVAGAASLVLAGLVFGAGCQAPAPREAHVDVPHAWRDSSAAAQSVTDEAWWRSFGDPRLNELVEAVLAENKDLRLAALRIEEERAQLGVAEAARSVQVDAQSSFTHSRMSTVSFPPLPPGIDNEGKAWESTTRASWDLDLWGRLASASEAQRAELLASEWARRAVVVSLVNDVTQAYFQLLELDRELDIARSTLTARADSLRLVEQLRTQELGTELDVARARGELESAAVLVPDIERRAAQTENRLQVLLGRSPATVVRDAKLTSVPLAAHVPAGLPSELLERRPDVQEARAELAAANARIDEAHAARFPQLTLTGDVGAASQELSDFSSSAARTWHVGPALSMPIFDAGRRKADVEAARVRAERAAVRYEKTVLDAFREVEDALVERTKTSEARARQTALAGHLRQAHELANQRSLEGLGTYLDVLDAQRQLLAAELELARLQRAELGAVASLHAALGGGWRAVETARVARR